MSRYGVVDEKPSMLGTPFTIPTPALPTRHTKDVFTMTFANKNKSVTHSMPLAVPIDFLMLAVSGCETSTLAFKALSASPPLAHCD